MKTPLILTLMTLLLACGGSDKNTNAQSGEQSGGEEPVVLNQTGIGRYRGQSDCTAFFLDLGHDDAPAYMVTNGHCAQNFSESDTPYAVLRNQASNDRMFFGNPNSTAAEQVEFKVAEIIFSTMRQTDLAVLRLDATVRQVRAKGIQPIAIQNSPLAPGQLIQVISAPAGEFLKKQTCTQGPSVDVTEFVWVWSQLQSNDCAEIYPGMSGSPVINPLSGQAVGMINTTTVGMTETNNCYLGSPCEIRPEGSRPIKKTSYAVPIHDLPACFIDGRWAPQTGKCALPLENGPVLLPQSLFSPLQHKMVSKRWQFEGQSQNSTEIKFIIAGQGDCLLDSGYVNYEPQNLPWIPTKEGTYLVCLREGKRLTVHPIEVDNTAPTMAPILQTIKLEGNQRSVELQFKPPEISGYETAIATSEDACNSLVNDKFTPYFRVPLQLTASEVLCIKVNDRAGNQSTAWAQQIR
jgi:Trypsin-like peptidase domain